MRAGYQREVRPTSLKRATGSAGMRGRGETGSEHDAPAMAVLETLGHRSGRVAQAIVAATTANRKTMLTYELAWKKALPILLRSPGFTSVCSQPRMPAMMTTPIQ